MPLPRTRFGSRPAHVPFFSFGTCGYRGGFPRRHTAFGWMAERSKALVSGISLFGGEGSHPSSVTSFCFVRAPRRPHLRSCNTAFGWMAERSKALDSGTSLFGGEGSNPSSITSFLYFYLVPARFSKCRHRFQGECPA